MVVATTGFRLQKSFRVAQPNAAECCRLNQLNIHWRLCPTKRLRYVEIHGQMPNVGRSVLAENNEKFTVKKKNNYDRTGRIRVTSFTVFSAKTSGPPSSITASADFSSTSSSSVSNDMVFDDSYKNITTLYPFGFNV